MPNIGQQHSIEKSRQLQRNLYLAAKKDKQRRFHALYDRIFRLDILWRAWKEVRENKGSDVYNKEYIPSIIKWGRITNLLGVALAFAPILVCTFVFGLRPSGKAILTGFLLIASMEGVFWIVEPISYFSVLGIPGTYMSFLSGNISNLRLPVALATQEAAEVEIGSEKGTVISAIGIGVSVILNVVVLTVGVILGSTVLSMIPQEIVSALTNIVPALFGALMAQQVVSSTKNGIIALLIAVVTIGAYYKGLFSWVPGGDGYFLIIIICVFGTILLGRMLASRNMQKEEK